MSNESLIYAGIAGIGLLSYLVVDAAYILYSIRDNDKVIGRMLRKEKLLRTIGPASAIFNLGYRRGERKASSVYSLS